MALKPHDPRWLEAAAELRSRIRDVTGIALDRIEHVGSTAVRDLPARPILDIDLGLQESDDIEVVVWALVAEGFIDRGFKSGGIGRLLVWESEPAVRTAHVHIVHQDSDGWRRDLEFRNALRRDPSLRRRYAKLKSDLADRFPADRTSYRHGKKPFFEGLPDSL